MGHDITAYTKSGEHFSGPNFGIFNPFQGSLYSYLDAQHHNAGASGDGNSEDMTLERLRIALERLESEMGNVPDSYSEHFQAAHFFLKRCVEQDVVRINFC
jgi:hypothetical protein